MAEELKGLIEKIQEEGVRAAQGKAKEIELEATRHAEEIVAKAHKQAKEILDKARAEVSKVEEGGRQSLKQVARDLILALREEITRLLERIVLLNVGKALEPKETAKLISVLIKEAAGKDGMIITINKDKAGELGKAIFSELGKEIVKGVTIRASEEIKEGFTISYDSGRSYFEFTDRSLAEYIASFLRPKLAEILKGAVKEK